MYLFSECVEFTSISLKAVNVAKASDQSTTLISLLHFQVQFMYCAAVGAVFDI